jgi:NADH dehydrogenase
MALRRVTVFGGSGFIGRHLVQRLARRGVIVRVAVRDPEGAAFLKPMGNPGQVVPMRVNIADHAGIAAAVEGADAVVNLVGILYERGRRSFNEIHVNGAGRIARAAVLAGARRFVQVSALGADRASPARYGRSKAAGEAAVREAFSGAVVLRPSVVFGPEDDFFNRFAALARLSPVLPVIGTMPRLELRAEGGPRLDLAGDGGTRFQPVYVGDVADAIMRSLEDEGTVGQTFELGGSQVYRFAELMELMLTEIGRKRLLVPVPFWAASVMATAMGLMPVPPLTRDQVRLLRRDNVLSGTAPGLEALGLSPTSPEAVLPTYLDRFRVFGRFADRPTA